MLADTVAASSTASMAFKDQEFAENILRAHGMDDYLRKPIQTVELDEMPERWTARTNATNHS